MRILTLILLALFALAPASWADALVWRGPTKTLTVGLSRDDVSHIEFPEPITNLTVEDSDYIDAIVVEGYNHRAFRIRSQLPKMATRAFFTGSSGNTYIVVFTTDVPYRTFVQIVNGVELDSKKRTIAGKFGALDLVRSMAQNQDVPGINRETYVIPNWFRGNGMTFDLSEIWQSPTLTGLVVHVTNEYPQANEVNLPAVVIPRTNEWGNLRYAAMDNLRLAPSGQPNDKGVLFLVFLR